MKGSILTLGILYLGSFLILVSTSYFTEAYRHNSIISTMTESGQIASINSIDKSSRIERGKAEITESSFKRKFKDLFEKNSNIKLSGTKYDFNFLKTSDGGIKAVRVKITDDRNTNYQVTFVSNIVN
ncbi:MULTISPECIES: hypothetical protein [Bacillus subtilis group]|uniref:hypothetical protein n=1 Tax=Bacillus subtilis group TaxID=653685 RepID=UPI002280F5B8|nr:MULTISPECIES: hypothetical protein [Bacillus subtilis group]MCY8151333.1 hypothetical protein [Bacillus paralicheniformis]MEC1429038.1 hypothetical protein [Bacillus sonorensis]